MGHWPMSPANLFFPMSEGTHTLHVTGRGRMISIGLLLAIPACSGPLGPDPVPERTAPSIIVDARPANEVTARRVGAGTTFPLLNGTFTLTMRGPDGTFGTITGRYTGNAASSAGRTSAVMDLQITD